MPEILTKELYEQKLMESVQTGEPLTILRKDGDKQVLMSVVPKVITYQDGTQKIEPVVRNTSVIANDTNCEDELVTSQLQDLSNNLLAVKPLQPVEQVISTTSTSHLKRRPLKSELEPLPVNMEESLLPSTTPANTDVIPESASAAVTSQKAGGGAGGLFVLALLLGGALLLTPGDKKKKSKKPGTGKAATSKDKNAGKRRPSASRSTKPKTKRKRTGLGMMPVIEL